MERAGRSEKAIVITAYGSAENAVEALKAGAFDYLTKPVDLQQFRAVVASALGRSAGRGAAVPRGEPAPRHAPRRQRAAAGGRVAGAGSAWSASRRRCSRCTR